ncbi:MAG TPA: ABC transporter permease [Pyrinomonadaceae bacterium]|jgi:putative ABC transport system permease protein
MFGRLKRRLRALLRKRRAEHELDEELRYHLERLIEQNIAGGMSPEEARFEARRSFGGVERAKDECRDARGLRLVEELRQDLRYGARMLLANPGFTAVAVLTLALGIGANSAVFSLVNAALLRPLPYSDPQSLVMVWANFRRLNMMRLGVSAPEFLDYRNQNGVFAEVAAFQPVTLNLTGTDEPERLSGARVSPSLFPLLGTAPLVGRTLAAEEERPGQAPAVVLSHRLWQRRFGSDPGVTGRSIKLDGESYTVIGVMPPGFQFPFGESFSAGRVDVWLPLVFSQAELTSRDHYSFRMIARLKPGVTVSQARAEMSTIGSRLEQQYPRTYRGPHGEDGGWQVTVTTLQEEVVGNSRLLLLVLLCVVAFVLAVACANIASMLLARAITRHREVAIRTALGAGRARLVRQFLTESMLLALLGGAVGLFLAMWIVELLVALGPREIPRLDEAGLDAPVLLFTLVISIVTGLLFGLVPALQSEGASLSEALKEGSKGATASYGQRRLRGLLVVTEIALSLVLLVGAGLMLKSFQRLLNVDPGFDPENVLTMQVALTPARYTEPKAMAAFYDQLLTRVKALPGIESASITTALPMSGPTFGAPFSIEGRPLDMTGKPPHAEIRDIAPGYFQVMRSPLVRGRDFGAEETDASVPVVIINETLAHNFFGGEDALGRRIKIGAPGSPRPWMLITGIVRDVKSSGLDAEVMPEMYRPYSQNPGEAMTIVARTKGEPSSSLAAVRREVLGVDRDQPVYNMSTMKQLLTESVAQRRLSMLMLGAFSLIALVLAGVGIYGVTAYMVAQRTHEIGIRLALGARRQDILKLVVGQGMVLSLTGVGLGVLAALALTRFLSSLLYGVSATDPLTFASIALLLSLVALAACYIPARRAMRVDPMEALRYE